LERKSCDTCDNRGWETTDKVAACNCCNEHEFYSPQKKEIDITEIRGLLAAVTPGGWSASWNACNTEILICCNETNLDRGYVAGMSSTNKRSVENARLVASAPYIIKTLLDRTEVLEKALIDAGKTGN
jgi:hypothetical protein